MAQTVKCWVCDAYGEGRPCHRCPHMPDKAVLPGCMGTAVSARNEHDLSYCTCDRPRKKDAYVARIESLEKRVQALEARTASADVVPIRAPTDNEHE